MNPLLPKAFVVFLLLSVAPCLRAAVLPPPLFSPGGGFYFDSVEVALFTAVPGATIYYTTDGSLPNTESQVFTFPFTLDATTTVRAVAVRDGDTDSEVSTAVFHIETAVEMPAPTIAVTGKRSIKTKKAKVRIRGTAMNAIAVEYQVGEDGDFKTARGISAWSFTAKVRPGKNVIFIYAIGEEEDSDPVKVRVKLLGKK